jgi:transposase-like protein
MDVPKLFAMWNAGARVEDIALAFNVSSSLVYRWRRQYALPPRPMASTAPLPELSPDELERRKEEVFQRHLAQRRAESPDVTRVRVLRERGEIA